MMEFIGPCTPIAEIYLKSSLAPHCQHRRMQLSEGHFKRAYVVDGHNVIRVEFNEAVVLVPLHKVEHVLLGAVNNKPVITDEIAKEPSKQPPKRVRKSRKATGDSQKS